MTVRVGFFHPDPTETSSWYRGMGPLLTLQKMGFDMELKHLAREVYWSDLFGLDWVFMMRPADPKAVKIMDRARSYGCKVWVDYDDDLIHLPESHKDWEYFCSDQARESMSYCISNADMVTATTENLMKVISQFKPKASMVIPNAINDILAPKPTAFNEVGNQLISWRGGPTHGDDMRSVLDGMMDLNRKGFRFLFIGARPSMIYGKLLPGTFSHIPWAHFEVYTSLLSKHKPALHMTPLVIDALNQSKSNISWLESTWFGGTVNLTRGGLNDKHWESSFFYETPEEFSAAASIIMESPNVRKAQYEKSLQIINEKYLLSKVSESRAEILRG